MSPVGEQVIAGVLSAAADGDEAAFERIVTLHHDDMTRVAYLISGDVDVAREAVQAAWAIVWRKLRTLRDPDRLRPWLMAVAANETRQLLRRRRRTAVLEIDIEQVRDVAGTYTTGRDRHADRLDLLSALARLTPDDREVLVMRFAVGLTSGEIAEAIGLSAPGVRSRLARSLERLRRELGDA